MNQLGSSVILLEPISTAGIWWVVPCILAQLEQLRQLDPLLYVTLLGDGNVKLDKMDPLEREDDRGYSDMVDQSPG